MSSRRQTDENRKINKRNYKKYSGKYVKKKSEPVHGVCGFTGTLLVGLFSTTDGLFYGGGIGLLAVQAVGALTVGAWALLCGFVIFKGLDKIKGLRVTPRIEEEGLDIYEHGETAYN